MKSRLRIEENRQLELFAVDKVLNQPANEYWLSKQQPNLLAYFQCISVTKYMR